MHTPDQPNVPRKENVPLCVDLDGTLIKTDLMWESLCILLRKNPFRLLSVFLWWMRGRAFLKQKLAAHVQVNAAALPYNESFLEFLRVEKQKGRKLILATASDRKMAQPVFDHVRLFDELLASDGKTNLRGEAKRQLLVKQYGERGFDYAGNSFVDFGVWPSAREAIVVNASRALVDQAAQQTKLGPTFIDGYSPLFQMKRILNLLLIESRYLYAMIGGLLLSSSFPKIGIAGLAWVAPAFMMAAAYGKIGADAFRIGYVAGLAHFLSSLGWLLLIPVTGYPILGWISLCMYLALYPAAWVWMASRDPSSGGSWLWRTLWALAGAAAWVAMEMIRARLLGGFPWNLAGASQFQLLPMIQIVSITGVYGVSFLVVWTSLSLFSGVLAILRRPTVRYAWAGEIVLPLAVLMAIIFFGMARLREQNPDVPTLRVTCIQPSIPQAMIWDQNENDRRLQQVLALSERALTGKTELLIWPESALPAMNEASYTAITNLTRTHRVWMIVCADDVQERPAAAHGEKYEVFNAAFLFDPDGRNLAIYHKQKLVMFGEYIPLVESLPLVKWLTPITGGFTPGKNPVPFELGESGVKTSTLICFEDMFPHVVPEYATDDTDFLLNLTSDAWFGRGAAQWQHMVGAIFRAVENGLPLVRSCNDGITCWVDSRGRLRQIFRDETGGVYGPGVMTTDIPLLVPGEKRAPTFYNRHGDWFGWSCVGFALVAAFGRTWRKA